MSPQLSAGKMTVPNAPAGAKASMMVTSPMTPNSAVVRMRWPNVKLVQAASW
ncbi:hypothetical protein [Streptomyces sp. MB09-02B]|uniref:hypothetical protein n=1 Tax=Streptomyces sp. MB09-02B TaxID=3028667 RepID=UPI0029AB3ACB|nr:hypothetical protein [Streptomyces sp. MB09-02B]MDX3645319.1 hypothetical protein [Streptomyces sp. MB09-02B]